MLCIGVAVLVASVWSPAIADATPAKFTPTKPVVSRYIVVAASAPAASSASAAAVALGGHVARSFSHAIHGFSVDLTARAAAQLAQHAGVVSVGANNTFHTTTTENNATWGLDRIDQTALPLDHGYTYANSGAGVTAYVVDTGLDAAHTEFTGRVNTGYNVFDGLTDTDDSCIGHGTHVSGTIGGTTYGVAKSVRITPVLIFDCLNETTSETIIAALDWIVTDHQSGDPAVLNMSLGGPYDGAVNAATTRVVDDGVFVSVAAGNDNADACSGSPASALGVVSVGAVDRTDTRASFSDFGPCVDLFAPGVQVTSASIGGGFLTASGTSMAAPHVTGAAARFLSVHPTATPSDVKAALLGAATVGAVQDPGTGSPNLLLWADPTDSVALPAADPTPPSTPVGTFAEAWDEHSVHVTWDAATDNVGVAGYRVFRAGTSGPIGSTRSTEFVDTATELTPGTTYSYTIESVDLAGNVSAASAAAVATTSTFSPLAPVVVDQQVSPGEVDFVLGDPNEPGVTVSLDVFRDGQQIGTAFGDPSFSIFEFSDFDVSPGATYLYQFRSVDRWDDIGAFSSATVTIPPDVFAPSPPVVQASAISASRVQLQWSRARDDVTVAGYRVYRGSTLIATLSPFDTSFVDTGRHADTQYSYAVRAFDEVGNTSSPGRARVRTFPALDGYWMIGHDGGVFSFNAGNYGSDVDELGSMRAPATAMTSRPDGRGYWVVDRTGRVFAHGTAPYLGNATVANHDHAVAIVSTPSGNGYWVATQRGRVFAFGDAPQDGPTAPLRLQQPIVGMARTPNGRGYWLVAADGGIFAFGNAAFHGSTGAIHLNQPVVGMAATPSGHGYWLVASDGGIFGFGDANYYGSTGARRLNKPIVGMAAAPGGHGYLLAAADGGIFTFGNARFRGGLAGTHLSAPIAGITGR